MERPALLDKYSFWDWKKVFLAILIVIIVIRTTYGSNYEFLFYMFLILNAYLLRRTIIRQRIANAIYRNRQEEKAEELIIKDPYSSDESNIETRLSVIKGDYSKCPQCGEDLIPGLDYCESCGYSLNDDK